WSEAEETPAPFPAQAPVHHGSLPMAIRQVQPDLVHVHWSNRAASYRQAVADAGLPLTVRDHAFDFSPELLETLQSDPTVRHIYLFPHLASLLNGREKIRPMNVAFNGELYCPAPDKDRRLVVRVGAGLPTKEMAAFFRTAQLCPNHRFVLALCRCVN